VLADRETFPALGVDWPRDFSCSRCWLTERLFLLSVLTDRETFPALGVGWPRDFSCSRCWLTERLFLLSVLTDRETFPALGVDWPRDFSLFNLLLGLSPRIFSAKRVYEALHILKQNSRMHSSTIYSFYPAGWFCDHVTHDRSEASTHESILSKYIYIFRQSVQVHSYIYFSLVGKNQHLSINHVCKRRVWTYLVNSMKMNRFTWSSLSCTPLDMGLFGRVPQAGPSVWVGSSACDCALRRMANLEGSSKCAIWN